MTPGQAAAVTAADTALARVTEFVREGIRSGRISDASGQVLIEAAEQQHAAELRAAGVTR